MTRTRGDETNDRGVHAVLTVTQGVDLGRRIVIRPGQTYLVGRDRDAGVRFHDTEVSRRHALLELRPSGLFLTDLDSTNGTQVAGRRLAPEAPLRIRSKTSLTFGKTIVRAKLVGFARERLRTNRIERSLDAAHLPQDEFEVLGLLGSGAAGRVWAARQRHTRKKVAIKVLRAELQKGSEDHQRLLREARLYLRINSPHVVELLEVRVVAGRPCLIMELVPGPTAEDRVSEAPLPINAALRIGEDVARALTAVASAGVIHRDVKPANILLGAKGRAKLGDFGISKELGHHSLTEPGVGLGSLPYIAPEQALGARDVTPAADVFALGATLYHLISGAPHFVSDGHDPLELAERLHEKPRLLSEVRPDCPPALASLVQRMMALDPVKRPKPDAVARRLRRMRKVTRPDMEMTWRARRSNSASAA